MSDDWNDSYLTVRSVVLGLALAVGAARLLYLAAGWLGLLVLGGIAVGAAVMIQLGRRDRGR